MDIGIFDSAASAGGTFDDLIASATRAHDDGFASWWVPQIFGFEALSLLAVVGREVPDLWLGTAVVPTYPRHPVTMAQLALTAQAASGGRLTLGIGLSHQMVIENMFGMSFDHPARHMADHLAVLMPLLRGESVAHTGESVSASMTLTVPPGIPTPDVVVAALGPRMLDLAGRVADGTVTWMTGPKTLEQHIVPSITAAATDAGRKPPRVVAALPVLVTDDEATARARCGKVFEVYGFLPSYRAMLDREGVEGPADVAIIGSETEVREQILAMEGVGVTEFVAVEFTRPGPEADATRALLRSLL
ncbi:MAG: TIGR03564 family F420-dependent LLM class oxidoreductase [Acidimicrobiales bacterium]